MPVKRVLWVARRLIESKFLSGRRLRAFDRRTEPFVHTAARGLKFQLEPDQFVDRHIFVEGIYESRFLAFVRDMLKGSAVALDIGANIGNHAIYLADAFEAIHCFEPNPQALRRLRANIALNGITNVEVHAMGISNTDAELPFRAHAGDNLGASGFVQHGHDADDPAVTMLRVRRGDDVIEELKLERIDFIKIDVEGHEPVVFEGLARSIRRYRPVIAFEFHAHTASNDDWQRIVTHLPGYTLVEAQHAPADATLMQKLRWNYRQVGRPVLRRFVTPEPRTYENVIAFPSEEMLARAAA